MKTPLEKVTARMKLNRRSAAARLPRERYAGRWQRIEDGLGHLSAQKRYRLRCRMDGRCPDCGRALEPERAAKGRVRCLRCTEVRTASTRRANAMRRWLDGASEEHVVRLCIGKGDTLPRDRRPVTPLVFRCARCNVEQVMHWHGQEGCRLCGARVWPEGMTRRERKRWMRRSDEQKARDAIG